MKTQNVQELMNQRYLSLFKSLAPLMGCHDLDDICVRTCNLIASVLEVSDTSIMLAQRPGGKLRLKAATHIERNVWEKIELEPGEGVPGNVYMENESLLVRGKQEFEKQFGRGKDDRDDEPSCVLCPLHIDDITIGVINVANPTDHRLLDDHDLELIKAVAQMIGGALKHAQHYSESMRLYHRMEEVLDNLLIGLLSVDHEMTVRHHNAVFATLLHTNGTSPINRPLIEVLPGKLYNVCFSLVEKAKEVRKTVQERVNVDVNGHHMNLEITVRQVTKMGYGSVDWIMMFTDVGQELEVERLRESDRMKHCFMGIISHELRTPLAVIKGALPLIEPKEDQPPKVEQLGKLHRVLTKNTRRLIDVVNSILMVTEIENKTISMVMRPVKISKMLHQCAHDLYEEATAKRLEVSVTVDENLEANMDERRMRHVISELLMNAIKFSTPRHTVSVNCYKEDGKIIIEVTNHGQPLPEAVKKGKFEKFSQGDDSATRRAGGVGLGLFLTANVVRLHGGDLTAEQATHELTTFRIWIDAQLERNEDNKA